MKRLGALNRKWLDHVRTGEYWTIPEAALAIARAEALGAADVPMLAAPMYRRLRSLARRGFIAKVDGVWRVTEKAE